VNSGPARGEAELLREGCEDLGMGLTAAQHESLLAYLDLLYVWNRSAGLTTIPRRDAVRLHLLDSLAALSAIDTGPCLDLGSGGGLPGLVLAIACPSLSFVLLESNRRKCSFLLEAARITELANVRVLESNYERFQPEAPFPTVVSRAFRPPAEFLRVAQRFVQPAGRVVLMLAGMTEDELSSLACSSGYALVGCRRFQLPFGREPRTIATFRLEHAPVNAERAPS
jgi:16S rRNA (guanine527-N7)-methyltransferase